MKMFKLLFSAAIASAFIGCSSMDVDEQEAYSENLPGDFSSNGYMALHPELRYLQIKDCVFEHNASLSLTPEEIAQDSLLFAANSSQLQVMYSDPYMGGYTDTEWEDTVAVDVYKVIKDSANKTVDSSTILTVYLCDVEGKISHNAKKGNAINLLKGSVGTPCVEGDQVLISDSTYELAANPFPEDGMHIVMKPITGGSIPANKMKKLREFNFNDQADDLAAITTLCPIDTFAISYQYVLFGKIHGWAYRTCTDAEKNNPISAIPPASDSSWTAATKLYCRDGDADREIN